MSPSRRRAIGAVRGLASCVIAVSHCRAHHPCGAMLGRRGSRLAPYRHYAREIRTHRPVAITPAMPRRAPRAHPVAMPSRTLSRLHTQHRTPRITWAARWNIAPYSNGTRQWSEQRARARGNGNGTRQWGEQRARARGDGNGTAQWGGRGGTAMEPRNGAGEGDDRNGKSGDIFLFIG